jgi:hypothetical protein
LKLIRRTVYLALSAGMAAGLGGALIAPAAHAVNPAVTDQSCTKVVGAVLITPGLTLVDKSQTFVIKGKASGCSAVGKSTATIKGKFTTTASCANFPNPFTTKLRSTWADTTVSVLRATFNVDVSLLQATITGKVVSGPFLGDAIHNKQQYTLATGDCSDANPVTKVTFKNLNALTFTH